ncbi:insulin gene enhancer protein ISL-2 isoform X1 [Emydura macquarii macquarii]|uniref:insulin gene enhancer protein ISL-2 isoform X1 n=1 Tax=Emydura macquarii macquarii TaxID=1129001 RepID=UPI00352BAAD0
MCVGCGSQIHDQYILKVSPDLEWHAACLKCAECSQFLDETCTCFVRDGKTYCKRDYIRLFGIKCAKCKAGFSSSDLVMRARENVYHIECFRCSVCSRQLLPGDEFSLRDHELLCRADHSLLLDRNSADSPRSPGHLQSTRGLHLSDSGPGRQPSLRPHVHKQTEKTTRVRTVLNEKQLHTLRTCYAANPRPDALMKEQLVEMTGLSPRVIRVWFQNKRCKDKKKSILMKQLQQQQHSDKTVRAGHLFAPPAGAILQEGKSLPAIPEGCRLLALGPLIPPPPQYYSHANGGGRLTAEPPRGGVLGKDLPFAPRALVWGRSAPKDRFRPCLDIKPLLPNS